MLLDHKHIFIVEDDAHNLTVMMWALKGEGAIVYHDYWGVGTVDRMNRLEHLDVILMDLMLPHGRSGYDVFDEMRSTPELTEIPVIIVSASDPNMEMNKAREKGFMGFIPKPIDRTTFPRLVATVLTGIPVWADDLA